MSGVRSFLIVICCSLICFLNADAQRQKTSASLQQKSSPAARKARTSKAVRSEQVKVLIRKVSTGVVALDGGFLLMDVEAVAKNAKPRVLDNLRLTSVNGIRVELESRTAIEFPNGQKWAEKQPYDTKESAERDAAGFDFLVSWTLEWNERSKYSMSDKTKIDVKEIWKVEKVPDPSVTKTWSLTYLLTEEESSGLTDPVKRIAHAADEQTAIVIAPRRGPILKEIRAFIEANRTKQKNAPSIIRNFTSTLDQSQVRPAVHQSEYAPLLWSLFGQEVSRRQEPACHLTLRTLQSRVGERIGRRSQELVARSVSSGDARTPVTIVKGSADGN